MILHLLYEDMTQAHIELEASEENAVAVAHRYIMTQEKSVLDYDMEEVGA
jgi:hypothetical protein